MVVNETCGVHFHIDCPKDAICVYNIFYAIADNQEKILKEFGVPNNRLGRYCKLYSKEFIEGLTYLYSTKLLKEEKLSIEDIQLYLYERLGEGESRDNPRNPARYYLMNMDSIHKLGTLEFRWFNSTLSPVVIKSYIERLLGIIYENRF